MAKVHVVLFSCPINQSYNKKRGFNLFNFNSKWAAKTQGEPSSNAYTFVSACNAIAAMLKILGVSDIETISAEVDGTSYEKISLS